VFFYFSWAFCQSFLEGVSDVFFHHHSSCSSSYSCRSLFLDIYVCTASQNLIPTCWCSITCYLRSVAWSHFPFQYFFTPQIIVLPLIKGCGNVSLQSQKAGPEMKLDSFQCAVKSYSACAPNSTFKFTFYPRHFCRGKGL
jgi:hypothetical protein